MAATRLRFGSQAQRSMATPPHHPFDSREKLYFLTIPAVLFNTAKTARINLTNRFSSVFRAVFAPLSCDMYRFAMRNGLYRVAKRHILEAKTARLAGRFPQKTGVFGAFQAKRLWQFLVNFMRQTAITVDVIDLRITRNV